VLRWPLPFTAIALSAFARIKMSVLNRCAVLLLVLVAQCDVSAAFQTSHSRRAFAPRQTAPHSRGQPLEAAFVTELASMYSYGMEKYYLATQSMTGGLLCGVGDAMAQVKERFTTKKELDFSLTTDNDAIDFGRVFRFALKGLGGGIIWSQWYGMVDGWSLELSSDFLNMIGDEGAFGDGIHRAAKTVSAIMLEQFVACPIVYSLWDIPFPMVMNGAPVESVPGQVKQKIGPLLMENAKIWSFLNIIIYNLPVEFRLLAMSTADIFWQSVIASVAAEATADADEDGGDEVVNVQSKATERKSVARLTE